MVINGTDSNEAIVGTAGDDDINAKKGDDVVLAGEGNDTVVGGDGNDALYGEAGNDDLNGGKGNDYVDGGAGDDLITGAEGDDIIVGGPGDDLLAGGGQNDTFVFNFNIVGAAVQKTIWFRDGSSPSENADYSAWSNYDKQLDAWRAQLDALYGGDLDAGATYDVSITVNGGSAKKPTTSTFGFSGDASYSYLDTEYSVTVEGEGYDQVLDWNTGSDMLVLAGLSADNYDTFLDDSVVDGNLVITFDGGSITLMGCTDSLADLVSANKVAWSVA